MPWTSKRKWYAARSRTWFLTSQEGRRNISPAIVWRRHVVTTSPWGFTRQDRLAGFRIRNEIRKRYLDWQEAHSHFPPTYGTTRRAVPHAVDVNGHFVPLDTEPIKIETTIGEQEENKS